MIVFFLRLSHSIIVGINDFSEREDCVPPLVYGFPDWPVKLPNWLGRLGKYELLGIDAPKILCRLFSDRNEWKYKGMVGPLVIKSSVLI